MGRFKVAVADFTSFRLAALTALLGCALMSGGAKSALASTGPLTAPKTTFATQPVYTASGPRAITITNAGPDSVPIKQVFPETTQPVPNFPVDAFFLASDGCTGVTLAPGHTCQVSVDFDPQSTGSITRSLDVSTDSFAYFFALSGSGSSVVSNPGHPVPHIIAPASYLGGIPVRVTWTASSTSNACYEPQENYWQNGWDTITAINPQSKSATTRVGISGGDSDIAWRVSASKCFFPVGGWVYSKEYSPYHVHPWDASQTTLSGTWTQGPNGTEKSTTKGASATFTCSCTTIGWVSAKGPTHGSAAIYINGIYQKTVSTYASANKDQQVVWAQISVPRRRATSSRSSTSVPLGTPAST